MIGEDAKHIEAAATARTAVAIAVLSAAVSIMSVVVNYYFSSQAQKASREAEVSRALAEYISAFDVLAPSVESKQPFYVPADYAGLSDPLKRRVEIVSGRLVQVVDAMAAANDCRKDVWAAFLQGVTGPVKSGYPLQNYAKTRLSLGAIHNARIGKELSGKEFATLQDRLETNCTSNDGSR